MSSIKLNDIFDELIAENKSLKTELIFGNKCLDFLHKFKTDLNLIFDKLKSNLSLNEWKSFVVLEQELCELFGEKAFNNRKSIEEINKTIVENSNSSLDSFKQLIKFNAKKTINESNDYKKSCKSSDESLFRRKTKTTPDLSEKISKNSETIKTINEVLNEKQFICDFIGCGKGFKLKKSLNRHFKTHHNSTPLTSQSPTTPLEPNTRIVNNRKQYFCDVIDCNYRTFKKFYFQNHRNRHNGVKPYPCSACTKQFISERTLRQHMDNLHSQSEQTFECDYENCNKVFKTQIAFNLHQRSCHLLTERNFRCNQLNCSFTTFTKTRLRLHIERHTTVRPFVCSVEGCLKSYKTRRDLGTHLKDVHVSGQPFLCPEEGCNKRFKSADNLRKHKRIHSSVVLSCVWPGCEYRTAVAKNLENHRSVHTIDTVEPNFLCVWPECDKRFKTNKRLKEHLRIHESDKRYACHWPGCQYRCVDSGNIRKHMRIHNK